MYPRENELNDDRDDSMLEAALDEVLGGIAPPDMTARIMDALAAQHGGGNANGAAHAGTSAIPTAAQPPMAQPTAAQSPAAQSPAAQSPAAQSPAAQSPAAQLPAAQPPMALPVAPPVQPPASGDSNGTSTAAPGGAAIVPHVARSKPPAGYRDNSNGQWLGIVIAASVLVAGLGVGIWALRFFNTAEQLPPDVAVTGPAQPQSPANDDGLRDSPKTSDDPWDAVVGLPQPNFDTPSAPATGGVNFDARRKLPDALPSEEVLAFIDNQLKESWAAAGVQPAPPAGDDAWCRRVFLQLLGRIPTVEEREAFVSNKSLNKKDELVEQLLTDESYREEYAHHWSEVWCNVLVGRLGGRRTGDVVDRDGLHQYLYDSLLANKPYDVMVRELITATGSNRPGTPDFNGATNFVLSGLDEDASQVTSNTCRIFLGRQVQCAQCHDHPTQENFNQQDFWQLTAFFRQADVVKNRRSGAVQLVNADFAGDSGEVEDADVFFQDRQKRGRVAYPVYFDGTALPRSGRVTEVDRRAALAKLITRSEDFSQALVNRMWARFFNYGFTPHIEDLGPHQTVTHPQLLTALADQFAAHGYDQQKLLKWIALSDAYGRSSEITDENRRDDPLAEGKALFSRYYPRQLPAEAVYDSVLVAINAVDRGDRRFEEARLAWLGRFSIDMDTDDAADHSIFDGSVTQSLEMMNGSLMRQATSIDDGSFLKKLANSRMKPEEKIEHLFLTALTRRPNADELSAARRVLSKSKDSPLAGLQDLWWALLNSNEFILDH